MTSIRVYGTWCVLLTALVLAMPATATTIVMPTDDQLIDKTPVIVRGTVVLSGPVEIDGGIWTETVLSVEEALKGDVSGQVTIREVGGRLGEQEAVVFGSPVYRQGEEVLAFLWPSPRGHFQTMDLFIGKFSEEWTIDGQRLWYREAEAPNTVMLDQNFDPIDHRNVQRDASAFRAYIRDEVAGRPGDRNYGVSDPRLARDFQSNFSLIAEPTNYRWFAFQDGKSVSWKGYGSQPGYSNGGVDDTKTAMGSWNGYGEALIRYQWDGMSSTSPGGLDKPNGINEVVFGDPLNEISGSWTGQGGVVGRGGFNRVSRARSWTSTFAADGSHQAKTYSAYEIAEGNLVIQDGVSPSKGISSQRFAEIVAHEFGHTLGFGHSDDSSALMYSTVTGLGPTLRADDKLAARWLYPSESGGTLKAPAAPTNLAAHALSATSLRLNWTDNSDVETSQTVYADSGSGYVRLTTAGADVQSLDVGSLKSGQTYSVRVTASNSAGESSASNTATVTTPQDSVTASFAVTPTTGTAGVTTFAFADKSTGPISSWQWNFGDGTGSTSRNASKVYGSDGTYQVSLTVRGSSGQQASSSAQILVGSAAVPAVTAAFDVSTSSAKENEKIAFYDRSTGSPTWWQWTFGDGETSAVRNPSHAFSKGGTYKVTLKTGNASSSATVSRSISIGSAAMRFNSLVPASTTVAGVGGTNWRTDLTVFNASTFAVNVDIVYLPGAGEVPRTSRVFLGASQAASWRNVLSELFGISSGAGALQFATESGSGTPDLRISSRTYTDSSHGTYGQFVGDLRGETISRRLHLAGLANNDQVRSNVGLVNRSEGAVSSTLSLYASNGSLLGRNTVALAPHSFQQQSLRSLFPVLANTPRDQMSMEIVSNVANAVTGYGSIIDNVSQDPVFVPARAAETSRDVYVAGVGRTGGASGTYWRSDVTLFNPGNTTVSATVRVLRSGEDNRSASGRTISIGARGTRTIRDIMSWTGAGQGTGALQISWSGQSEGIVVTSRTYTTRGFDSGTLGQSIGMTGAGEFGRNATITGLSSDSRFRTNIGLVNSGDSTMGVTLRLIAPDGRQLASSFASVVPKSQIQWSAATLFPGVSFANLGNFTIVAETPSSTMFAYGSVIDNQSGDPIFVSGR